MPPHSSEPVAHFINLNQTAIMILSSLWRHSRVLAVVASLTAAASLHAAPTQVTVQVSKPLQTFDGLGCDAIFYEAHMTSLAAPNRFRLREGLFPGWRIAAEALHVILFCVEEDGLQIVRVLHSAMDLKRHLPPDAG